MNRQWCPHGHGSRRTNSRPLVVLLTPLSANAQDLADVVNVEAPSVLDLLDLEPGATLADVGAGVGGFTQYFAEWTGESGHVYATDIGSEQLALLRTLMDRENLSNVTVVEGAVDSTNLPEECCDGILLRNVFHELTDPAAILRSIEASLRPGGRLAVIDFPPRANSEVPPGVPANRGGHGIPPGILEDEVGALLSHVRTLLDWAPDTVPARVPANIPRPFVMLFEKTAAPAQ
jgi:SAM-dependent methyltransferase